MSSAPTSAMIFAAGFGTRMGALTQDLPKPMIPLLGRPMIDHAIDLLRAAGIDHIVANTHYLHDAIAPHLRAAGVTVVQETDQILDTGGGLKAALPMLGDGPVLTLNPDAAWTGANPAAELLSAWRPGMQALLLLQPLDRTTARRTAGDFDLTDGRLSRGGPFVYAGAQIIDPARLDEINEPVFSLNAYWDHLKTTGGIDGTIHDGGWCDIGHPDGLIAAEAMLRNA